MAQLLVVIPREQIAERFECWHSFQLEDSDNYVPVHNTTLVCPRCQKIWAYLGWEGHGDYWPQAAYCRGCKPGREGHFPPAGSILLYYAWGRGINTELLQRLPRKLLEREFKIHLARIGEV